MKKYIVFANGSPQEDISHFISPEDVVICADGGTHNAIALGITPHVIIGDLDSISPTLLADMQRQGVQIFRHPVKKDKTDLELVLDYIVEQQGSQVYLFTALGGRIDQMLGNLLIFKHPSYAHLDVTIFAKNEKIYFLHAPSEKTFFGKNGDLFSILPVSSLLLVDELIGVEWPLKNKMLQMGSSLGLSNKFLQDQITLCISQGNCLVIHTRS